jgi:hypothetical protein
VAVIRRMIKVARVQTRSLRLSGRVRICHPYIDTRIRYGHAAMYDRPHLGTTDAPRTNGKSQEGRGGGAAGGERPRQSQGQNRTKSPERQQMVGQGRFADDSPIRVIAWKRGEV